MTRIFQQGITLSIYLIEGRGGSFSWADEKGESECMRMTLTLEKNTNEGLVTRDEFL